MTEDLLGRMVWRFQLVISNSREIKDVQVSPDENLLFALMCLNSLLVFVPGILGHERVLRSAARPCPQHLLQRPLCCHSWSFPAIAAPEHSPGGVKWEHIRAWPGSLPSVLLGWKGRKGWSRTAAAFMVSQHPPEPLEIPDPLSSLTL